MFRVSLQLEKHNVCEGLGEQVLWEHETTGKCFHSFFEFSQTFTNVSFTR